MKELRLSNGAVVRLRPVPPHVGYQLWHKAMAALPPEPRAPMSKIRSAAGHEELVPADKDAPEYREWQAAHAEWRTQRQALTTDAGMRSTDFALDYSIVAWKLPAPWYKRPFQRWQSEPPAGWRLPAAIQRHGVMEVSDNPRLDHIKVELLAHNRDIEAVREATLDEVAPLTNEEVGSAAAGFPADVE